MFASVMILLMVGAVVVMVKRADEDANTIAGLRSELQPKLESRGPLPKRKRQQCYPVCTHGSRWDTTRGRSRNFGEGCGNN